MFWFLISTQFPLIGWLFSIWNGLSTEIKLKIIEAIISTFETIFRQYYRNEKG